MERAATDVAEGVRAGIGGVGLAVRDPARVENFYRDVIGLEVVERGEHSTVLGADGVGFLELIHEPGALPDEPNEAGLFHTAFLMPTRGALADWLQRTIEQRTRLDGASDHLVSEAVYLTDPEGNGVEVYADRPRETWQWRDGQVKMATEPLDVGALLAERSASGWMGAPPGSRIGHVHLRVGDVARAVEFYRDSLELEVVAARPGAAFLSWGRYHHHIAVNTWRSPGAGPRDPRRAGLRHVTFAGTRIAAVQHDPWRTELRLDKSPA